MGNIQSRSLAKNKVKRLGEEMIALIMIYGRIRLAAMKLLLLISSTFEVSHASVASVCASIFESTHELPIINKNVRTAAVDYSRIHRRNLVLVKEMLGRTATKKIDSLNKTSAVIDSGAGLALASAELAVSGVKVYAINAQDFWQLLLNAPLETQISPVTGGATGFTVFPIAESLKISFDGINLVYGDIYKKGQILKVVQETELNDQSRRLILDRVSDRIKSLQKTGNFNYLVGFSENVLPKLQAKVDLVWDLYGPFTYSNARARLLDLYYEKLKDDGIGVIRISTNEGDSVEFDIVSENGNATRLVDFLIARFPDVFSVEEVPGSHAQVLLMRRSLKHAHLKLSQILGLLSTKISNIDGMEIPIVDWEVKLSP